MKINLRMSSIAPMLDFLRDLKAGHATSAHLATIFNHPDYDYEFRRYGAASKEPLIDYFINLNTIKDSEIPALRPARPTELRDKHYLWINAYENPRYYESLYTSIQLFITDEVLAAVKMLVENGLPDGADLGTIDIISTMSIGGSFGYVFDGAFHFDLLRLKEGALDDLLSLLAHETHHVAKMNWEARFVSDFSLEEWFIHFFSGEGLAIKFCNNAQGALSKPLYDNRPVNDGIDSFTMEYLNKRFDEALEVFEKTHADIRSGKMDKDAVWKHLMEYWYNCYAAWQTPDETPVLQQSMAYSFGNDFYGVIYDVFGKKVLFDCVRHPLKAITYFKRASGR